MKNRRIDTPENEIKSLSGVSKIDTHKQRKEIFILGKIYSARIKKILAELFSTGEIDRIDEIK